MQINSIDELSGWMHKTVDMVRRVTGDKGAMALTIKAWDHVDNGRDFEVSVWSDHKKEHFRFRSIAELEHDMRLKMLLMKRFS